jgi:hypothetical protein
MPNLRHNGPDERRATKEGLLRNDKIVSNLDEQMSMGQLRAFWFRWTSNHLHPPVWSAALKRCRIALIASAAIATPG